VQVVLVSNRIKLTPVYECVDKEACAMNVAEKSAKIKLGDLEKVHSQKKVGGKRYEKSKKWNARNGYQGG